MSKPKINFRYDSSLSPRSVSEMQKGPLKINSLVDSLNNPQYEPIKLKSSEKIQQPPVQSGQKRKAKGEETSILDKANNNINKAGQIVSNASKVLINTQEHQSRPHKPLGVLLKEYQIVVKDPTQQDYIGRNPHQNNDNQNEGKAQQGNRNKEKQIKTIKEEKDQPLPPQKPQKQKYIFSIAPPPPTKKPVCCNIFGWCQPEKQRTYPIQD